MGREDLYVAMTRGRHTNHTYVALPDDDGDCHPETGSGRTAPAPTSTAAAGSDVLQGILATSHAERSATETWHDHHPDQAPPLSLHSTSDPGVGCSPTALRAMPPVPPERSGLSR